MKRRDLIKHLDLMAASFLEKAGLILGGTIPHRIVDRPSRAIVK